MYLLDTNIWLERLLDQDRSDEIGRFLDHVPPVQVFITDFAFHSVIISRASGSNDDSHQPSAFSNGTSCGRDGGKERDRGEPWATARESRKHDISKARTGSTILLIWTFASCFSAFRVFVIHAVFRSSLEAFSFGRSRR